MVVMANAIPTQFRFSEVGVGSLVALPIKSAPESLSYCTASPLSSRGEGRYLGPPPLEFKGVVWFWVPV